MTIGDYDANSLLTIVITFVAKIWYHPNVKVLFNFVLLVSYKSPVIPIVKRDY